MLLLGLIIVPALWKLGVVGTPGWTGWLLAGTWVALWLLWTWLKIWAVKKTESA